MGPSIGLFVRQSVHWSIRPSVRPLVDPLITRELLRNEIYGLNMKLSHLRGDNEKSTQADFRIHVLAVFCQTCGFLLSLCLLVGWLVGRWPATGPPVYTALFLFFF